MIAIDAAPSAAASLSVVIADDHPLILAGIRRTLENAADIAVVGEARATSELMRLVAERRPDIVLMDLRMPGATGGDAIARVRRSWPAARVVVLSASEDDATIGQTLRSGASAYVLKSALDVDIADVLRRTAHGDGQVVAGRVSPADARGTAALTDRERAILAAVAAGKTTAVISQELWVSSHTIKFHLTNIYRKLGVANRAAAVRYALEHGLG